jgi:hypothetical protein
LGSEDIRDAATASAYLARRRAKALGRPANVDDLVFSLSLTCLWPVKPPTSVAVRSRLRKIRRAAMKGASTASTKELRARLDPLVPDSTLRMGLEDLHQLQKSEDSVIGLFRDGEH